MTLKSILQRAVGIICDDDLDLDTDSKKRQRLISSANMIYHELTEEHVHMKYEEKLTFQNGRLYYSNFLKNVKDILSIKQNGEKKDFTLFPAYVKCDIEGEAEVCYIYHGNELSLSSETGLPPEYSASILAIGVASEYFYRSGLIEEALFYKNRYDTAILNLSRKRKEITLKTRRFL